MSDDPIARAKAYLAAQPKPPTPARGPEAQPPGGEPRRPMTETGNGAIHYLLEEVAQLADDYAKERHQNARDRKANRELREAVIRFGRRNRIVVWGLVALGVTTIALGAVFISRNRQAIRVSCTLLSNAIIQAGAGPMPRPDSAVARASAERQRILIGAVVRRVLTRREARRLVELDRIITRGGGVIAVPQCEEIVRDPGRVKSLVVIQSR